MQLMSRKVRPSKVYLIFFVFLTLLCEKLVCVCPETGRGQVWSPSFNSNYTFSQSMEAWNQAMQPLVLTLYR